MPRKFFYPGFLLMIFLTACAGPTAQATPTTTPTAIPTQTPLPTDTSTPAPTPTPVVYDGQWSGTTDAGGSIEFTIQGNALMAIRVNFGTSTKNSSCNVDSNTSISPGLPIAENGFQIDLPSINITAAFDSPTTASGTLAASEDSRRCHVSVNLTWTAEKQ